MEINRRHYFRGDPRVCVCVCVYMYIYIYIYIYINCILHTVSTPTCFSASASSSGGLNIVRAKVTKLLKPQLKISRVKCHVIVVDDNIQSVKC